MAVSEYREFFLRVISVSSGDKPDKEANYPTTYKVKGATQFNRFLAGNYPSEGVVRKLFDSITFKLNPEDKASSTVQGLVRKATDTISENRTNNPNTDKYTLSVQPHQLPEVVLATDGSDAVIGTPVEQGGLKLSILRRTVSTLFRKNFKLEVNVSNSVVIDGTSKKLQLFGDALTPGNVRFYGTDEAGVKGWRGPSETTIYTREDFLTATQTLANIVGGVPLRFPFTTGPYKFHLVLFIKGLKTLGIKVGATLLAGSPLNYLRMSLNYTTPTDGLVFQTTLPNLTVVGEGDGLDGVVIIDGVFECVDAGMISFQFAKRNGVAGTMTLEKGSYMSYEKLG